MWQNFVHYVEKCINAIQILEQEKKKKIFRHEQ